MYLNNDTVPPSIGLPEGADPCDTASYAKFTLTDYAPELMFRKMTDFIEKNGEKPFFLYWATPIPHMPLQAPKKWIDYYRNKFGAEDPYLGERSYYPHRYPHAAYAAMISYLDEQIGKLVLQLKEQGLYENTLIIFTSDNGPSYNGGTDSPWFDSARPFASEKGRGKGFVYEGGIRVPMIASWPGHIAPGSSSDHISSFYDVMPTLCEVVNVAAPDSIDGISFLPVLTGKNEQEKHAFLYWEFPENEGQLAIRMGDWKFIRRDLKTDQPTLELYNLSDDPEETQNVAGDHPDRIKKAKEILFREHTDPVIEKFQIPALIHAQSEKMND